MFDGIVSLAKACLENGIPVGLGTDTACPYVTQYDMWREPVLVCQILRRKRKVCAVFRDASERDFSRNRG